MRRLFAILIACFVVFATTGAQRVVAAHLDTAPADVVFSIEAAEKAPCCKSYQVDENHLASACNLPLVMLPASIEFTNRQTVNAGWAIRAGPALDGVLSEPGEQPPKQI